jgi:hypothetical protein
MATKRANVGELIYGRGLNGGQEYASDSSSDGEGSGRYVYGCVDAWMCGCVGVCVCVCVCGLVLSSDCMLFIMNKCKHTCESKYMYT